MKSAEFGRASAVAWGGQKRAVPELRVTQTPRGECGKALWDNSTNFQKWRTQVIDNSVIYWVSNMSHTLHDLVLSSK